MKCSKCGCTVFHENELDKLECANKADGPMKDKAKAAFDRWMKSKGAKCLHDAYLVGAEWAWGSMIEKLAAISTIAYCNTEKTLNENIVTSDNDFWSVAFDDVVLTVKREIKLQAENKKLQELHYGALGWMYAEACRMMDDGIDIRKELVPDIKERYERQCLKEIEGE